MTKTQTMDTIRYSATCILSTSRATTATLPNYRYLLNLGKRMDTISASIGSIGEDFENEPVATIVANSIHEAITNLIPIVPVLYFDHEYRYDLNILVSKAIAILDACDEGGLGSTLSDKFNTFMATNCLHKVLLGF